MYIAIGIVVALVVLAFLLLAVIAIYNGWREVKSTPRIDAFNCEKCGPISKAEVIYFVDVPACGICWYKRLQEASTGTGAFQQ